MSDASAVTQAEFSRRRGVSRKTVTMWKDKGLLVQTPDGLVDIVATEARLAGRPSMNRGGVTSPATVRPVEVTGSSKPAGDPVEVVTSVLEESPEEIAAILGWSQAEAARVKEVYLALLRKQEYEAAEGKLVDIDEVGRQVEREYAVVRERLLAIPGKMAAKLADQDRASIELALFQEISEALNELHDPDQEDGRGGQAGGKAPKN